MKKNTYDYGLRRDSTRDGKIKQTHLVAEFESREGRMEGGRGERPGRMAVRCALLYVVPLAVTHAGNPAPGVKQNDFNVAKALLHRTE